MKSVGLAALGKSEWHTKIYIVSMGVCGPVPCIVSMIEVYHRI